MNSIIIEPTANIVQVSLFDVLTTTYFLNESMTMEKHEEVGDAV